MTSEKQAVFAAGQRALKDLTLTQYDQIIGNIPVYTYDSAGRPQTLTYGDIAYTYAYKPGTNLIDTITVGQHQQHLQHHRRPQ